MIYNFNIDAVHKVFEITVKDKPKEIVPDPGGWLLAGFTNGKR
jgi:hypothetical protein